MNASIIQQMIQDSIWQDVQNETVYKFTKEKELYINDTVKLYYTVKVKNNKVSIVLNNQESYYIDYINDFILNFYNNNKAFRLIPA